MTTEDTHRKRARDAINAARRGHLPKPQLSSTFVSPSLSSSNGTGSGGGGGGFQTAQENSIEVYDDQFGRNTILTRSARMRKFKFYQYKPVQDSPSSPKSSSNWTFNPDSKHQSPRHNNSNMHSPKTPILLPREDVMQGKIALSSEQSKELGDLDDQIRHLEKEISRLNDENKSNDNVNNLDQIFELVNKKNDLLRRQMQLNIIEQEKSLEKANEQLTKELRSLMAIDDSRKSKTQLERQKYLYEQSLILVNKRNELVHQMDVQEKGIEDDNALKATLKNVISSSRPRGRAQNDSQDQNCIIQ